MHRRPTLGASGCKRRRWSGETASRRSAPRGPASTIHPRQQDRRRARHHARRRTAPRSARARPTPPHRAASRSWSRRATRRARLPSSTRNAARPRCFLSCCRSFVRGSVFSGAGDGRAGSGPAGSLRLDAGGGPAEASSAANTPAAASARPVGGRPAEADVPGAKQVTSAASSWRWQLRDTRQPEVDGSTVIGRGVQSRPNPRGSSTAGASRSAVREVRQGVGQMIAPTPGT